MPSPDIYRRELAWSAYSESDPRPLGRHVEHDERSKAYPIRTLAPSGAGTRVKVLHDIHIDVLDQGNDGTCTGNAGTADLASNPTFDRIAAAVQTILDEQYARNLYSDAEEADGNGKFPPNDNGSSGLSIAKVLKARGLIKEYRHAFGIQETLDALQLYPCLWGTDWLKPGMDNPTAAGRIVFSGTSRGGHELLLRGHDPATKLVRGRNSWGASWGPLGGEFDIHEDDLAKSLASQGDVTVLIPLDAQPTPVPTPAQGASFPDLAPAALANIDRLAEAHQMTPGVYLSWRFR